MCLPFRSSTRNLRPGRGGTRESNSQPTNTLPLSTARAHPIPHYTSQEYRARVVIRGPGESGRSRTGMTLNNP